VTGRGGDAETRQHIRVACVVLPALQDRQTWERVLEILAAYSPLVEEGSLVAPEAPGPARAAPDAVAPGAQTYLDASGVASRYGSEEAWCRALLEEVRGVGRSGPGASRCEDAAADCRGPSGCGHGARGSRPASLAGAAVDCRGPGASWSEDAAVDCRGPGSPGSPERGVGEVLLGVAGSKYAAWVAARTAPAEPGYQVVAQGRTAAQADSLFLAPLAVSWLPLPAEVQRRLHILGIYTIGRFAALPPTAVAEQFTPLGLEVHRWARGLDERPVIGRRCQVVEAQGSFEAPEARCEAIIARAMRLSEQALEELPVSPRAWAVKRIELHALFSGGEMARRSVWLDDTPGQQTLRALLGGMVDSLREGEAPRVAGLGGEGGLDRAAQGGADVAQVRKLAVRGEGESQVCARSERLKLAVRGEGESQVCARSERLKLALRGEGEAQVCARSERLKLAARGEGWGVEELTVRLLGLEPAQGRQMDLFASIETRQRLEQTLQQLAKKHGPCVTLVVALDVDAPLLEERYAFVRQDRIRA